MSNHFTKAKVIVGAGTKLALIKTKEITKRKLLSKVDNEEETKTRNEKVADILIEAIGELKGVSVKLAQHISLSLNFLPDEVLKELENSFDKIPPLNKAVSRRILKQELGEYPETLFDSFDRSKFRTST